MCTAPNPFKNNIDVRIRRITKLRTAVKKVNANGMHVERLPKNCQSTVLTVARTEPSNRIAANSHSMNSTQMGHLYA